MNKQKIKQIQENRENCYKLIEALRDNIFRTNEAFLRDIFWELKNYKEIDEKLNK